MPRTLKNPYLKLRGPVDRRNCENVNVEPTHQILCNAPEEEALHAREPTRADDKKVWSRVLHQFLDGVRANAFKGMSAVVPLT